MLDEELAETAAVKRPNGTVRSITKRQALVKRIVDDTIKGNNKQLVYLFQMLHKRGEPEPFTLETADEVELQRLARQFGASSGEDDDADDDAGGGDA